MDNFTEEENLNGLPWKIFIIIFQKFWALSFESIHKQEERAKDRLPEVLKEEQSAPK